VDAAERNARINALARKKRAEGLTEDELQEQQRLRLEYLREFRQGMEQMLESIVVEQPDGSVVPLRKRSSS
jgi:uncharacterized protein YnzC (UPF0291/DUF896 family)